MSSNQLFHIAFINHHITLFTINIYNQSFSIFNEILIIHFLSVLGHECFSPRHDVIRLSLETHSPSCLLKASGSSSYMGRSRQTVCVHRTGSLSLLGLGLLLRITGLFSFLNMLLDNISTKHLISLCFASIFRNNAKVIILTINILQLTIHETFLCFKISSQDFVLRIFSCFFSEIESCRPIL